MLKNEFLLDRNIPRITSPGLRNVTSTQMKWIICFAYFQSRLRYGIMFWGGDGKSVKIFQLQKKVIWLITGVHVRESCRHIFRKFQILTLASLYILEVLCFVKKYQENLKQNYAIHGHNTRNKFDLPTRYCSTVLYHISLTNMGIQLFSKLPMQIKQLDNHKGFMKEMKTFHLNNSFCTIEEFLHFERILYCTLCRYNNNKLHLCTCCNFVLL